MKNFKYKGYSVKQTQGKNGDHTYSIGNRTAKSIHELDLLVATLCIDKIRAPHKPTRAFKDKTKYTRKNKHK